MMIMQPHHISESFAHDCIKVAHRKKGIHALENLRFEPFKEGRSAQLMHIGPFSDEGPTIQRIHKYIEDQSSLSGKHHEIYLSDIRRAAPQKWRTVIRQPMA